MTRKFWMLAAYGLATAGLFCAGASAQAVRLVTEDASAYFADDADGRIVPTSTPTNPPPKKPSIGSGLDSLSSPSDTPPNARPKPPKPPATPMVPAPPPLPSDPPVVPSDYPPVVPGDYPPSYVPGCDGVDASPACGYEKSYADDGYTPDCCCCGPLWTFRAEALIWDRANSSNQLIATGTRNVTAGDYDFDWAGGPRLTAIRHGILNGCWDLEFAYFGIDGWSANQNMADVDTVFTTPTTNIIGVIPFASTYHSQLYSTEVNLRRPTAGNLTWLAGVRYLELQESLRMNLGNGVAMENLEADNHLYGFQVGVDGLLLDRGNWYLSGLSKLGIFSNSSDTAFRTTGVGGAVPYAGASGSDTAFLAEIGLNTGYRLTNNVSLLAGYNLLWLDGIADAPSQLTTHNIATGAASVEANNTAFYHGVNLGVQWMH